MEHANLDFYLDSQIVNCDIEILSSDLNLKSPKSKFQTSVPNLQKNETKIVRHQK
jgi:hypothetical protein